MDGTATWQICACEDSTTEGIETTSVSIISSSDGTNTYSAGTTTYLTAGIIINDTSETNMSTLTVQDLGDEP